MPIGKPKKFYMGFGKKKNGNVSTRNFENIFELCTKPSYVVVQTI
jgi:hypothetical protein